MPTATGHTTAIRAKKVIGADVRNAEHDKIGVIEDIVLDKLSNNVMFAVVGFGGFLGMAEKYHPIPWGELDYDPDANAYIVNRTKDELKAAPADSIDALTKNDATGFRDQSFSYYGAAPYW